MSLTFKARRPVACAMLAGLIAQPVQAQFSGLLRSAPREAVTDAQRGEGCEEGKSSSVGSKVVGGFLGRLAGRAAGRAGVTRWVPVAAFTDQLSEAIACKLDPKEQEQAAEATLKATRSDGEGGSTDDLVPVGTSAEWTSQTREDVSGRSTVSSRQASVAGGDCITVTDVVIIRGEETRADKRMCRPVGSRRYSIVA